MRRNRIGRSRARNQQGAVAVEFALILPLLIMLLLGVSTLGLTYSDHLAMTNAVRESSRLGGSIIYTQSATPGPAITSTQWANSVQLRVQQTYANPGSLPLSRICVALDNDGNDSNGYLATPSAQGTLCGAPPPAPTLNAGECVVKVWATKPGKIVLGVFPTMTPLTSAQSVAFYGRTAGPCTTS